LVYDGNMVPDPNTEITVEVHSDTSLFALGAGVVITGDANITTAMGSYDCNQYGWDDDWNWDPYIDEPNGILQFGGISWAGEAAGTVGYFKFIYNSGQVTVFLITTEDWSCAYDANCQPVSFSTDTLTFGVEDQNDSMGEEQNTDEISVILSELQPTLMYCPADACSGAEQSSKAAYENLKSERTADDSGEQMTEMDNVITISSNITTNQIWTSGNTYHVVTDVNVRALLVIEPGTVVEFAADKVMFVNNGGTLISVGTPNDPVVYTSDSGTPGYADYYCPMYIEETASANTKIMYSYVEYAYVGLLILNNELETDIKNNYFYNNVYGIVEYGTKHTHIRNNLVVASYYSGIEVFLGDPSGQGSADSLISIEDNTCDYYQDNGITVHGVEDVNEAGVVVLANNIVSGSYQYGLALVDDYMYAIVTNTGYFDNANNKNWAFDEDNPAFETVLPYEMGTGILPVCYLRQDCNFINTGSFLIEQTPLIGQTTDVNSIPDYNYVDIGFHYPNWNFSNPGSGDSLSADFDDSMEVDFRDFATFANCWQQSTSGDADLDESGFVDYNDLSIFANQWLQLADPNIEINVYGDSNEGYVDIGISGFNPDTQRVFLFADGKYVGELFGFANGDTLGMDISESGSQEQQLKVTSISNSGQITCSNIKNIAFSCPLSYCLIPSGYEPNKPLHFSALSNGAEEVSVKVYADGGDLVWSQTYDGNNILGSVPAQITSQHEIDYISFDTSSGLLLSGGASVTKVTDPVEPDMSFDTKALIILPDLRIRLNDFRSIWAVQDAFKSRGIKYKRLGGNSANYDMIAWYAATNPIKYMYVDAHGNYQLVQNGVLRTVVKLHDTVAVSIKQSDFAPGQAPSWCQKLEGSLETTTKSFFSMGFTALEFAYFDCCYSGHLKINASNQLVEGQAGQIGVFDGPHSDISLALGMGETSVSRAYQGWYDEVPTRLQLPLLETEYQKWTRLEWEELGDGEYLYWALMHVIGEQTEFGPDAPVNNYRLKGQGSLMDIELSSW